MPGHKLITVSGFYYLSALKYGRKLGLYTSTIVFSQTRLSATFRLNLVSDVLSTSNGVHEHCSDHTTNALKD